MKTNERMSVLNRIEQELRAIEESKRSITTALRFTRAELEQLEALATKYNTTKADIIRTALNVVYSTPEATQVENNEIDF